MQVSGVSPSPEPNPVLGWRQSRLPLRLCSLCSSPASPDCSRRGMGLRASPGANPSRFSPKKIPLLLLRGGGGRSSLCSPRGEPSGRGAGALSYCPGRLQEGGKKKGKNEKNGKKRNKMAACEVCWGHFCCLLPPGRCCGCREGFGGRLGGIVRREINRRGWVGGCLPRSIPVPFLPLFPPRGGKTKRDLRGCL